MLFSILFAVVAIILGASPTFAYDPYLDPCRTEITYTAVKDSPLSRYNYSIYTVSSGDLCCNLCHHSELDCIVAQWQKNTQQCMIVMNQHDLKLNKTATCPNGRILTGQVSKPIGAWTGWIPGPCWLPSGMAGEIRPTVLLSGSDKKEPAQLKGVRRVPGGQEKSHK